MAQYETTLTREKQLINGDDVETEVEIVIEYTCYAAHRGHCDKYGAPEEPDEDAHVEIDSIIDKATGNEIEVTDNEMDKLLQEVERYEEGQRSDYDEPDPPDMDDF